MNGTVENYSHHLHWDDRDPQHWLVDYCEPPSSWPKGFGTERDWAPFFWQIWAHGTETTRFDVTEIIDVFAGTDWTRKCCYQLAGNTYCVNLNAAKGCDPGEEKISFGRTWDDLVATMNGQGHSASKRNFFNTVGSDNGLNY